MKAIVEYTKQEYTEMQACLAALNEAVKGVSTNDLFEDFTKRTGYAHYTFSGRYTERLVELLGRTPHADEIIMLVDGGFSHFGANCFIDAASRWFHGRINTD